MNKNLSFEETMTLIRAHTIAASRNEPDIGVTVDQGKFNVVLSWYPEGSALAEVEVLHGGLDLNECLSTLKAYAQA